jgi:glycosyltransferase involved in cell wall biosynthesis
VALLHHGRTSRNGFRGPPLGLEAGRTLPVNRSAWNGAPAPAPSRPRRQSQNGGQSPVARPAPTLAAGRRRAVAPPLGQMGVEVSVVIPTLNEADNLPYVLARLPQGLHEVLIVDGRSTDETVAIARRLRPDVRVLMQTGRGKGNALAAGFRACTGDIVVTLDADGSTDPAEIPRFVAALCAGADFVKGSRFAQGGASSDITPTRRWGNHALNVLVNALYRTSFTDLCYGYNAFWAACLPFMRVDCDGFEVETLVNVRVAKAGLIIHEVPSFEHDRLSGASNLRAVRDGTRVLRTIVRERISAASWRYRIAQRRRRGHFA